MPSASDPVQEPIFTLPNGITARPYHYSDAEETARIGNNRKIWLNLTDSFPHPYTVENAHQWIARCQDPKQSYQSTLSPPDQSNEASLVPTKFCLLQNGKPIGGIGVIFSSEPVASRTAQMGYWLGEEVWGQGIATVAAKALTNWAFETFPWLVRMEGTAYSYNPASMAVLKKAGYEFEAVHKHANWKDGKFSDLWMFVRFRDGMTWAE